MIVTSHSAEVIDPVMPRPLPLAAWRRRRLLTQRQLASQAGVTQATLVDIEHGRSRPRVGTMRKLAAALGVEVTAIAEFKRVIEADDQLSAAA